MLRFRARSDSGVLGAYILASMNVGGINVVAIGVRGGGVRSHSRVMRQGAGVVVADSKAILRSDLSSQCSAPRVLGCIPGCGCLLSLLQLVQQIGVVFVKLRSKIGDGDCLGGRACRRSTGGTCVGIIWVAMVGVGSGRGESH
eukprot:5262619-Pleurochrysis_carterae.AAC.3